MLEPQFLLQTYGLQLWLFRLSDSLHETSKWVSRKTAEIVRIWGSSVWLLDSRWIGKIFMCLCVCVYMHIYVSPLLVYAWNLGNYHTQVHVYCFFHIHTYMWQHLAYKWGTVRKYLNCQYHYSCASGWLFNEISVTQTSTVLLLQLIW